jgi:hypothetical protein
MSKKEESKKTIQEAFSLKEIGIFIGVLAIIVIIVLIPIVFKQDPPTMDELHAENYNTAPSETNYVYNGFSFLKLPDQYTNRLFWYTQYQRDDAVFDIPMRYGPKEVENVTKTIIAPTPEYEYKGMYITIDPTYTTERQYLALAVSELTEKFDKIKNYPMIAACTKNETYACWNRPIMTCNSTNDHVIVYFKEATPTAITINENCITIQGINDSLVKFLSEF